MSDEYGYRDQDDTNARVAELYRSMKAAEVFIIARRMLEALPADSPVREIVKDVFYGRLRELGREI